MSEVRTSHPIGRRQSRVAVAQGAIHSGQQAMPAPRVAVVSEGDDRRPECHTQRTEAAHPLPLEQRTPTPDVDEAEAFAAQDQPRRLDEVEREDGRTRNEKGEPDPPSNWAVRDSREHAPA